MSDIAMRGYVHPEVLVSTDWVAEHLSDPSIRIVESNEDTLLYASGHLPGAVHVDWTADLNDQIRRDYITQQGIRGADVAHRRHAEDDGRLLRRQEQLVGVLRLLGVPAVRPHERARHGRRPAEVGEGRAAADARGADAMPRRSTRPCRAKRRAHPRVPRQVLAHLKSKGQLVDVRSPEEYAGTRMHMPDYPNEGALRGGHIPGAKSIPWARAINPEDGTFKTAAELTDALRRRSNRLKKDKPTIAYCRIGERSSHTWFALKYLLGFRNVRNYDGSWTEWGNMRRRADREMRRTEATWAMTAETSGRARHVRDVQ